MNFTKNLITKIFIVAALAAFAVAAHAQPEADKVIVSGKYSLKQSDIDQLTQIYEWMMAGKFSPEQRRRFQVLLVLHARSNEEWARTLTGMLQTYEKVKTLDPETREQARLQLIPDVVAALEAEQDDMNKLLLEIYRKGQNSAAAAGDDSAADQPKDDPAVGGSVKMSDLSGIWSTSSVSGERYRSLVTGELSDPSGSIIEYQISPAGEIKYVGYLSTTVYSCTTKLFVQKSGRLSISGSNLTFNYAPGKRIYQTCGASASRNDTIPAERKTYPFRIERDEYGIKLCTVEEGKDFCIRRKSDWAN